MKALLYLIFPAVLLVGYGKSWDQQFEEWVKNPEPYGGLEVLEKIKKAKDSPAAHLILDSRSNNMKKISDLTPLAGLTNLTDLYLIKNNISDITHLAGLMNLERLWLYDNNISDSQEAMLRKALGSRDILFKPPKPLAAPQLPNWLYDRLIRSSPPAQSRQSLRPANRLSR